MQQMNHRKVTHTMYKQKEKVFTKKCTEQRKDALQIAYLRPTKTNYVTHYIHNTCTGIEDPTYTFNYNICILKSNQCMLGGKGSLEKATDALFG